MCLQLTNVEYSNIICMSYTCPCSPIAINAFKVPLNNFCWQYPCVVNHCRTKQSVHNWVVGVGENTYVKLQNMSWYKTGFVSRQVRCDCQDFGLVARIEASILVLDTIQVLYWPVLGQIQFCSLDRRCKTCLDTKPVLFQDRFCSLTYVHSVGVGDGCFDVCNQCQESIL